MEGMKRHAYTLAGMRNLIFFAFTWHIMKRHRELAALGDSCPVES